MMTENHWANLACAAYEAYAFVQPGHPVLWGELTDCEKEGWVAAVKEACHIYVAAAFA